MGAFQICALKGDGSVWCWGGNDFGAAGSPAANQLATPVEVAGLGNDVTAISIGYQHSCARKSDGTVWCWGGNLSGQLGDGKAQNEYTPLVAKTDVTAMALGEFHTCAIGAGAQVSCWGQGEYGKLGIGTTADRSTPQNVTF